MTVSGLTGAFAAIVAAVCPIWTSSWISDFCELNSASEEAMFCFKLSIDGDYNKMWGVRGEKYVQALASAILYLSWRDSCMFMTMTSMLVTLIFENKILGIPIHKSDTVTLHPTPIV